MKVKNLQLHGQTNSLDENSHQNDIFFRTDSASELRKETTLKGKCSKCFNMSKSYLNVLRTLEKVQELDVEV